MTQHEYRERAAYCRDMADIAVTAGQKSAWRRVAELWLRMAAVKDRRASEAMFHEIPLVLSEGDNASRGSL